MQINSKLGLHTSTHVTNSFLYFIKSFAIIINGLALRLTKIFYLTRWSYYWFFPFELFALQDILLLLRIGVVHKRRHEILEKYRTHSHYVTLFSTKASVLSSLYTWPPPPCVVTSFMDNLIGHTVVRKNLTLAITLRLGKFNLKVKKQGVSN